ncbi:MAG: class I SAM-dependent methyltransferase [Candidatus Omnitrophota bacterium]
MGINDPGSFKAHDISPEHLEKEQAERFARDIERLLSYRERFVTVPCPACGHLKYHMAFEKYDMSYVVCGRCETMYINPRPTPEVLDIYYSGSENYAYWNKYIFPASENVRREKIFRPRVRNILEICSRYNVPGGTIIEVGAGFGIFCEEIKKTGYFERVVGIEPTPDLAHTCRGKGIDVIEELVEKVDFGESKADVVAAFEVIEHLYSPRDFLESCRKILNPGGLIVLTCPNVKGFDISLLQSLSDAVDVEHLNYFNPVSLGNLLKTNGFDVIDVSTPGKLDADRVRNAALAGEFDLGKYPFLKRVLIDEWQKLGDGFQRFLADNGLSSHMWVVGRKKK